MKEFIWSNCNHEEPLFLCIGISMLTPGFLEQITTKENFINSRAFFFHNSKSQKSEIQGIVSAGSFWRVSMYSRGLSRP